MGLLNLLKSMKRDEREARILFLGLDNAGKTSILKKLSDEDVRPIVQTQGFNIKSLVQEGFKLNIWDIGGQSSFRPYWRNYFDKTDAVVFVVDSADAKRFVEARDELINLISEPKLINVPLLVFANKNDFFQAAHEDQIAEQMALADITNRNWTIMACSTISTEGLQEGMEWVIKAIQAA